MTGRIANKQGLTEGLNLWVAGLFIKRMNSTGHKHKLNLTLLLDLKEKRKYFEVLTASIKYLLLLYLSNSSCRIILGRMEDFLHYIPCWLCGASFAPTSRDGLFPSMHREQKQFSALIYMTDRCRQHT